MKVLAVGATGQFAGLVEPALVGAGVEVRALVHDPAKLDDARSAGAQEAVVGDLRDPASLRSALAGVEGLFLILPAFAEDFADLGTSAVELAVEAGVRRIVFSGVYHPSLSLVNHAATRPVEEVIYRLAPEFTVLQPAMYLQGLAGGWQSAQQDGTFAMPYSKHSQMSFVDYRDVAHVAATAFAMDTLVDGTFELASPGRHTRTQVAAVFARYAGRPVKAVDMPPERAVGGMPAGFERDGLAAMFADYTTYGFHGGNDLVLRTILGRPARTVEDYVAELAAAEPTA